MKRITRPRTTKSVGSVVVAAVMSTLPFSATAATLPASGTAEEATTTATTTTAPTITAPTGDTVDTSATVDDARLLLLLDSSYSMAEDDAAGTPKIEAARSALDEVIGGLDPTQQVGLRVFGGDVARHQPAQAKCTDSQLVVPIGTDNADELDAAVEDYEPTGETPIGYALQQAADDLGPDGNRTVLLVSDGIATCDPDPCEVVEQLTADGLDLVVHTVGLGVDDATRDQLQCIAAAAGGTFYDTDDTDTLTTALTRISTRAFRPFTIAGTPVEGTPSVTDAPVLGEGQYTDTLAQAKDRAKHYVVRREIPGSIIHVGATMRPTRGGLSAYDVKLSTRDGDTCGSNVAMPWSAGSGNSFGTAGASSALYGTAADDPCTTDPELVLTVYPQNGSEAIADEPYEMVVVEEPPVANRGELPPAADDPVWKGLVPGAPVAEVVAGTSLNDAPLIEPGQTYSSVLTRGEIVFFRVPVRHGQQLEALLEIAQPTGALAKDIGPVSDVVDINIVGPNRELAVARLADTGDLDLREILQPDSSVRAAAVTPQVRWANHASRNESGATLAGDYFVAVSLTSEREQLLPIPFTLSTQLVGAVDGVPEYAEAGTDPAGDDTAASAAVTAPAADEADDSSTTDADEPPVADASAPTSTEDSSDVPWAWLLGGAGVVVAAAGAALVATRHRQST